MATLNNHYIFVTDEDYTFGVDVTEHPVEEGIAISDHVKRRAISLSLAGEIVGPNAASILSQIKQMQKSGAVCSYTGRGTMSNCLITDFSTSHPVNIWGGCSFSMTLKEIRTAKASGASSTQKTTTKTGTQQITEKSTEEYVYYTVKKGDTIWGLVAAANAPYKQYGLSCDEVMKLNPSAFSKAGDFRTLQIGQRIIVGKR